MLAVTVQVPTLPEVIVTRPVGVTSHAPPLAENETAEPPGDPETVSEAERANSSCVGGETNDRVGDSRMATISWNTDAALN